MEQYGTWSSAGYLVCSHQGCSKKVRSQIDHDCCGHRTHDTTHVILTQEAEREKL